MMQFLQQLDEAAAIPLDQLKDAIKKDPRVKALLKRDFDPSSVDPVVFTRTLKFLVLNNPHVMEYVKQRGSGSHMSPFWFNAARKIDPKVANASTVKEFADVVVALLKDADASRKSKLSKSTVNELSEVTDPAVARGRLSNHAVRELMTMDGIRPDTPVRLYRGLQFYASNFVENPQSDGSMSIGVGINFLRSVRDGKRIVDLKWDRESYWTRSLDDAINYAHHGRKGDWRKEKQLTGVMGFVVSTLAQPDDILIDFQTAESLGIHGPTNTVILAEGTYTSRLVKKFTPKGEVDVLASDDEDIATLGKTMKLFGRILDKKVPSIDINTDNADMMNGLANDARAGKFPLPKVLEDDNSTRIEAAYDALLEFVKDTIIPLSDETLNDFSAGPHKSAILAAKSIKERFSTRRRYDRYKAPGNPNGYIHRYDQSASEVIATYVDTYTAEALSHIASNKRFTDWSIGNRINNLAHVTGTPYINELHRKGIAIQRPQMLKALEGIYTILQEPQPEDVVQASKHAVAKVKRGVALMRMLDELNQVKEALIHAGS